MKRSLAGLAVVVVVSCGGGASPSSRLPSTAPTVAASGATASTAPATSQTEKLAADAPRATRGGTTFTAPAEWTMTTTDAGVVLVSPDPDLRLGLYEMKGQSADDAVKGAWAAFHPNMRWPLRQVQSYPARDGWDERKDYTYETSPNEKMFVFAAADRHGDTWLIALTEGSEGSFERREAQAGLVMDSLRPQGYTRESFAGKQPHDLDAARTKVLTDFIEQGRVLTETPGVAITLVQNGKVVFAGGFGTKELGKPDKIDADTLFMIASNSKALTTLMLAKLVDETRFGWDTPVVQVYPAFKLGDPGLTAQIQMKHLICACTGMPRQDLEWAFDDGKATPESTMALLGTMVPTTRFGEVFQYSNVMAAAAGFIGGHVAFPAEALGPAYDDAMRTRVFAPLAMSHTTLDFPRALAGNHAGAYGNDVDDHVTSTSFALNRLIIPTRPAGGVWSSANDLTKYVMMELANGKLPDGTQYVTAENLLARRAPQVEIGEDETYGMGLEVNRRYGVTVVHHGGDLLGYHSDMFWLPDTGVGGVILTNADRGVLLRGPFVRRLLEVLFDGRPEAEGNLAAAMDAERQSFAKERPHLTVPPDPAVVAQLAAAYHNDALGDVTVTRGAGGGAPKLAFGVITSGIATRKNDDGTVSVVTTDTGLVGFPFVVGNANGKRTLTVRDAQHEYVFTER
jgi:CubicO group peptidase (beta-lactamase class C family)